MTVTLAFLLGILVGVVGSGLWKDALELFELYREERER